MTANGLIDRARKSKVTPDEQRRHESDWFQQGYYDATKNVPADYNDLPESLRICAERGYALGHRILVNQGKMFDTPPKT